MPPTSGPAGTVLYDVPDTNQIGSAAMHDLHFPKPFVHAHPPVRNVNGIEVERLTVGQRAAGRVAAIVGSWRFIVIQSFILADWAWRNLGR